MKQTKAQTLRDEKAEAIETFMQIITTRYHGPTDHHGARITATSESGLRATVGYPHELDGEKCHRVAVLALCERLGWEGTLIAGALRHGGYCYVWTEYRPGVPVERIEVK
jgi:hypothetical protein